MKGETTMASRYWASCRNASSANRATYQTMSIRKRTRNVRHHRPSTSCRLRPKAAPTPMFSTNIAGVTTIHITKSHAQSATGATHSRTAISPDTEKSSQ